MTLWGVTLNTGFNALTNMGYEQTEPQRVEEMLWGGGVLYQTSCIKHPVSNSS